MIRQIMSCAMWLAASDAYHPLQQQRKLGAWCQAPCRCNPGCARTLDSPITCWTSTTVQIELSPSDAAYVMQHAVTRQASDAPPAHGLP